MDAQYTLVLIALWSKGREGHVHYPELLGGWWDANEIDKSLTMHDNIG